MCKVSPKGKDCMTVFQKLGYNGKTSVVLCKPKTGRMHQIRVHLQFLGKFWGLLILLIRFYRFYETIRFDGIPVRIRLNQFDQQNQIQFSIRINRFYAPICSNRFNIQIQSTAKSKQNETVTNAQTFHFYKKKVSPAKKFRKYIFQFQK